MIVAAVIQQESDHTTERREFGLVDHFARPPLRIDDTGVAERGQMKGCAGRAHADVSGYIPGARARVTAADQESHDTQPGFLRQRTQRLDNLRFIHISIFLESLYYSVTIESRTTEF